MHILRFSAFAIASLLLASSTFCTPVEQPEPAKPEQKEKSEPSEKPAKPEKTTVNVALYAFNNVEVLDFFGPFDVLMKANLLGEKTHFNYYTVGATKDTTTTGNGLVKITPKYSVDDSPKPDIIILAGAEPDYIKKESESENFLKKMVPWLVKYKNIKKMMSVCVGALLLSKAGLLDGKKATTHHLFVDDLQKMTPKAKLIKGVRYTQDGNLLTTAGVTAGIDGTLQVIRDYEPKLADKVAEILEYEAVKL